jgi:hypothetical protein
MITNKNFFTADDELFMNMLIKVADKTASPAECSQVNVALQAFMQKPNKVARANIQAMRKALQAVSVSTDFALLTTNAFNVTVEEDNFDMGWEAAYQDVPRDGNSDFWEIGNIKNGVTFKKVLEGERVDVLTMTGTKQNIYVDYYGGALGFTDKAIRFRKLAQMLDQARAFRNKFYANKADNHYLLLATAAALNVIAYQGLGTMTQIQRDILTINEGAFQIGNKNKDKGYGDMANAALIMYANPADRARIEAAFVVTSNFLTASAGAGDPSIQVTPQPIRRVYTYNTNVAALHPILVLPGRKSQKNEAMAPTTFTQPKDILTLNEVQSVWSIYGAGIGDTDQCFQLNLV